MSSAEIRIPRMSVIMLSLICQRPSSGGLVSGVSNFNLIDDEERGGEFGGHSRRFNCKRPGNPFLPGSVVLGPVNSGLWAFSGEVSDERTGAGLA